MLKFSGKTRREMSDLNKALSNEKVESLNAGIIIIIKLFKPQIIKITDNNDGIWKSAISVLSEFNCNILKS